MAAPRGKRSRQGWIALAALVAALLGGDLSTAAAEAPTRDEYVARLEASCKPDAEATRRAMKGARADISGERLSLAAGKFAKATSIFGGTVKEISAVPRPPADTAKLAKWFVYLNRQESYLGQITAQLRANHAIRAQRLVTSLEVV
jgi:hypothetical protein